MLFIYIRVLQTQIASVFDDREEVGVLLFDSLVMFVGEITHISSHCSELLREVLPHLFREFQLGVKHLPVHLCELLPEVKECREGDLATALQVHHLERIDELLFRPSVVDHVIVSQIVCETDGLPAWLFHDVEQTLAEEGVSNESKHLLECLLVQLASVWIGEDFEVLYQVRNLFGLTTQLASCLLLNFLPEFVAAQA